MKGLLGAALLALCQMVQNGLAADGKPVPVDVELAFVVDASFSIDEEETRLQRQGYADAIANARVLQSVTGGFLRSVALSYIEFAAPGCVRASVGWTRISDEATARRFGAAILAQPKMECPGGNAIAEAIVFATDELERNGFDGTRRIIDVSGDGPNTTFEPVEEARDFALAKGITINGLVIERPSMPELPDYYRASIIGGPRAFVVKAESRRNFAEAILKKLILEIAERGAPPPRLVQVGRR